MKNNISDLLFIMVLLFVIMALGAMVHSAASADLFESINSLVRSIAP